MYKNLCHLLYAKNHRATQRMYKDIRGTGEVLYGAATRYGLIHTNSRRDVNRRKDGLLIGLRQNLLTYLRLKALIGIIRKTRFFLFNQPKQH